MASHKVTISLPEELWEQGRQAASADGLTLSAHLARLLHQDQLRRAVEDLQNAGAAVDQPSGHARAALDAQADKWRTHADRTGARPPWWNE